MANVSAATEEKVYRIKKWYGLNENPDGDTKLKLGEAAVMRNFRITRDGNLQRRPGTRSVVGLMRGYSLSTEQEPEVVRVDENTSGQLTMYPYATATYEGGIRLSGVPVSVSYKNHTTYIGHLWKNGSFVYSLSSCVFDQNKGTYTWNMRKVVPVGADGNTAVAGLWAGNVGGTEYLIGACDGKLWKLHDGTDWCKVELGDITTIYGVHMFGYGNMLYIMSGVEYKAWDGETLADVEGYRPLVSVAVGPTGGGTLVEQVNKLNGTRRCWVSPDGVASVFVLPDRDIASVDFVIDRSTGLTVNESDYTYDLTNGTVTFASLPAQGVNSYEIGWSVRDTGRSELVKMRFSETYNGANDNRVFLYGDGTNRAFYSGLDRNGTPRADYFPDMNVLVVGTANTPITSLIRHYSRLIAFKSDSTYSVQYGIATLADSSTVATFYTTPINRSIGNVAVGQSRLVLNYPRTLFGSDLYEWKSNSSYSGNLTVDERQASRISDRIYATLYNFDLSRCYCWDDNDNQEYYICYDGKALVHNYAADAWYYYTDFDVSCMVNFRGELFIGDQQGRLNSVSYSHRTDNGLAIKSYWESGSEAFDRDYMRKYSAMLWLGIKPETHGEVMVTVQTDRKSEYTEKVVSSSMSSFANANFRDWSFRTNRKPRMTRCKIKAKKFVFYKLVFKTDSVNTTATILTADIRVRFTGYAR